MSQIEPDSRRRGSGGAPVDDCWNRIGVHGDRSCDRLPEVTHCRNCPVFSAAGQRLLDRPPPPGYLDDWTARLAPPTVAETRDTQSVIIFRLGHLKQLRQGNWLTIAQDEKTSVVYGMPKAAARLDAAALILPLDQIAKSLLENVI